MPTPQNPVSEALGRGILAGWGLPRAPIPLVMPSGSLQVDLAVVEVGIGGAYDCTNIIR